MHFICQINRLTTTKVDLTYLGGLTNNVRRICPLAGLERVTTGSVVKPLILSHHTGRGDCLDEQIRSLTLCYTINSISDTLIYCIYNVKLTVLSYTRRSSHEFP